MAVEVIETPQRDWWVAADGRVLTEILLGREPALLALELEQRGREYEPLHAPELIEPETLNALRKLALRQTVTTRRAIEAVADLATCGSCVTRTNGCARGCGSSVDSLSAYDAAYVALAEALGAARLLTADRGQATAAGHVLGAGGVKLVV